MAEFSGYWTTNGAGSGDQVASYTQVHDSTASRILAACSGFEGVAPGYLNELACTDKADNTCAVNTGGAVVDGKWYINDASADVNIPSASGAGNTRIDRIVLRASWAGFDIAITRIAGTDAVSPTAPDITQTSGTTYDIQLCQVLVDTAGALTVTDERTWATPQVDGTTLTTSVGNLKIVDAESWQEPILLFGWDHDTRPARYRIDQLGIVHLRGAVKSGTSGTTVFQLPAGYRPGWPINFIASSPTNQYTNFVTIYTTGYEYITYSEDSITSLEGINYYPD